VGVVDGTLLLGAVAYDPRVVTIWEGFGQYLRERDFNLDYVLYSNYERQVDALLAGHIDVAWNSPLAWLQAQGLARARGMTLRPFAMRDTDCDVRSAIISRSGASISSLQGLRGKVVAVGASDSPQATLLPLLLLSQAGLRPGIDFGVKRHEVLLGLHGDHVGGERDAVQALLSGGADAACLHEANYRAFIGDDLIQPLQTSVLAYTQPYDHCNMTAGPSASPALVDRFRSLLLAMNYSDPAVHPLFDLEGLTEWRDARTTGYSMLEMALAEFGSMDRAGEVARVRAVG
jgi:ABC-type phosphate/phosphonate transport system substrate-binding protein